MGEVSSASLRRLVADTQATVAEAADGRLVAMANICLGSPEPEIALLVEDRWQRQGLGLRLACVLARQASIADARALVAAVLADNIAIRRTLTAAGLAPTVVGVDAGILDMGCDLLPWTPPRLGAGAAARAARDR